jgi:hypothetical protein
MADKLNEFAGKFGKGGAPKGLGIGMKLLAVAAAGAYGLKESMYTGKRSSINDVTILLPLFPTSQESFHKSISL